MSCYINPLFKEEGKSSKLHQQLIDITGNEEKALNYYKMVLSADFRNSFGDWTKWENHDTMVGRITPQGEPLLQKNSLGAYYFKMQGDHRHFINNQILEYSYEQRKALISTTIAYLLEDDVTSKKDIEVLDFNKLYNNDNKDNRLFILLNGNKAALKELENITKQYIGILAYKPEDKEDLMDTGVEVSEAESERLLDLRQSFEKNSKDNATANIKFLLSFVPEMNNEGELKTVPFDLNGQEVSLLSYYDFNELWTSFEENLAGLYPSFNGGYATDLFDKMLDKMKTTFNSNPTIGYLVNEGGLLSNLPPYKKNQFVHAFLKSKVNFYTTTVDKEGTKLTFKIFNSGDVTSRETKIVKELVSNIQHNKELMDNQNNKVILSKANKIAKKFDAVYNELIYEVKDNITLGQSVDAIDTVLKQLGIHVNENSIKSYIESVASEGGLVTDIEEALTKTKLLVKTITSGPMFKDNKFNSKVLTKETIIKKLASFEEKFRKDVAENTVLGANNKKYWTFSLPGYLNVKISEYKEEEINISKPFYNASLLKAKFKVKEFLNNFNILTFLNLRRDDGDEGVDNKSISFNDQYIDGYNKSVMSKGINNDKSPRYNYNIYNTLAPADKGRFLAMQSELFINSKVKIDVETGKYEFNKELIDVYKTYFKGELSRISEEFEKFKEYQEASDEEKEVLKKDLYHHYNYIKGKLSRTLTSQTYKGREIPVGNAYKFTLFEELNIDFDNSDSITDLQSEIFNTSDEGYLMDVIVTDTAALLETKAVNDLINNKLTDILNKTIVKLEQKNLITVDRTAEDIIQKINANEITDNSVIEGYLNQGYSLDQAPLQIISDSIFNQHIHNIEYSKLFTGDYAYYKNLTDFSKRIPATYIDGVMLNLQEGDEESYNMAVLPEVIIDGLSKKEGGAGYKDVDVNDAQGYITLKRWKFLMERLNKWNPSYKEAYQRMEDGTSTAEDHKYTAQPLKGVYFDVMSNGVPTYVKYSQAVLIPKIIKGTKLQNLYDNMVEQDIDEAVALSGVKVGGVTTSDVLDENKEFKKDMTFYKQQLKNKSWRLQQDLSPKGIKATLIGSQIKKNIIQNIDSNKTYNGVKGSELISNIENIYKDLSDLGLQRLQEELGLNAQGVISNREKFAELLLEEAKRNSDINLITALTNEYDIDAIVNNSRYQPLIASMINSATIKIKSNGASYIQMSAHGWNIKNAKEAGVKMLVEDSELKPPRVITRNGKKVVLPGQVFVTHSQIVKYIPDYQQLSMKELNSLIQDKLRYIVGYRIPNQDLASSDTLEIIGIIPPGMGDTMIAYAEITKKTGSDFDIDKMYAMLPDIKASFESKGDILSDVTGMPVEEIISILKDNGWDQKQLGELTSSSPKNKKKKVLESLLIEEGLYSGNIKPKLLQLEFLDESNSKNEAKILSNKLIDAYKHILTSPEKYNDLTASLDNNTLRDGLAELHNLDTTPDGFEFFTSLYQLEKKFANAAGKTGTGIISNHLVDQTYTQISNFTMAQDLGVGNYKDGYTYFNNVTDTEDNNKISQVLSWFLSAFVDIAKDPYITIGNYNVVTTGLSAMLIRSGAPLSWVSSYIGQPILKKYAETEMNKDSKILTKFSVSIDTITDELFTSLKAMPEFENNNEAFEKFIEDNQYVDARKDALFKEDNLKKAMKDNNPKEQYKIFQLFKVHLEASKDFEQTVNLSKADVNGAKPTVIENIAYAHKLEKLFQKTNLEEASLFPQLAAKFNTYLGTAHKNSIELVNRINAKEFHVGKNANIITDYLKHKPFASTKELEALGAAMNTFTISKNSFFNIKHEEIEYLLSGYFQDDILAAKVKYPNNVLLQLLEANSDGEFKFIDMENVSNKPPGFKNDIIRAWEDLLKLDRELGESLIKYSYVTSGFKFGMKTFYEFIPANTYKVLVEPAFKHYPNVNPDSFANFFYRHNPEYATKFKTEGEFAPTPVNGKLYALRLVQVLRDSTEPAPYKSKKGSKGLLLYKHITYDTNSGRDIYALIPTLGAKVNSRNIIEPSNPEFSSFGTADGTSSAYKNTMDYIRQADITDLNYKQTVENNNINYNMLKFSEGDFSDDTSEDFNETNC